MKISNLLFTAFLLPVAASEAASVNYSSTDDLTSLTPGQTFTVNVNGTEFTDPVVGGGFSVNFGQSVVQLDEAIIDTSVFELGGGIDSETGDVFFLAFSDDPPAGLPIGNFNIGVLLFTAIGQGSTNIELGPSEKFPWATTGGQEITDVSYGPPLTATVVPVPAALPLLGSALVGFGFTGFRAGRRKRALRRG